MNTLVLRQIRPGKARITCGTLSEQRYDCEARALRRADGLPVIAHDIDYPHATVLETRGEMKLHPRRWDGNTLDPDEMLAAQRILDLGGTLVTPLARYSHLDGRHRPRVGRNAGGIDDPFCDALWTLPGKLDPHLVDEVLGIVRL